MTELRPGTSPPPVRIPIRWVGIETSIVVSVRMLTHGGSGCGWKKCAVPTLSPHASMRTDTSARLAPAQYSNPEPPCVSMRAEAIAPLERAQYSNTEPPCVKHAGRRYRGAGVSAVLEHRAAMRQACGTRLLQGWGQRHHRKRSTRSGGPLIVIERERALKVRLQFGSAAAHVPGSIGELVLQKKRHATRIGGIAGLEKSCLIKCRQDQAGRVRIGIEIRILRPASVGTLIFDQREGGFFQIAIGNSRSLQSHDPIRLFVAGDGRGGG